MTREVVIIRWCDNHEEQVEATVERTVSVDGDPLLLDLCAECDAALIQPVQALLSEFGLEVDPPVYPVKAVRRHTAGNVCPVCGFESVSRDSLGQHLRIRHGKGIRDFPNELPMPKRKR